jgi:hypothetical protein
VKSAPALIPIPLTVFAYFDLGELESKHSRWATTMRI